MSDKNYSFLNVYSGCQLTSKQQSCHETIVYKSKNIKSLVVGANLSQDQNKKEQSL